MFLGLLQDLDDNQILPLFQLNNHWSLTKSQLISNVCPHQNSLLTTKACKGSLKCPYHGLQFDSAGNGQDNAYTLDTRPVFNVSGMIFSNDIAFDYPVDLSYMQLVEKRIDHVNTSTEIFMDVFLDIEHIPVAHPGVYDKVDITDISKIQCEFFDQGSHQLVYDDANQLSAVWTTLYPNTTIEWQKGSLFVNVAVEAKDGINVVVYKYVDKRYDSNWSLNEWVWEEAWAQDRNLCENIVARPTHNLPPLKQHYHDAIK